MPDANTSDLRNEAIGAGTDAVLDSLGEQLKDLPNAAGSSVTFNAITKSFSVLGIGNDFSILVSDYKNGASLANLSSDAGRLVGSIVANIGEAAAGAAITAGSTILQLESQLPGMYMAPTDLSGYQNYSDVYGSSNTTSTPPDTTTTQTSYDNSDSGVISAPPVSSYLPDGIITPPDQSTPIPDTTVTGDDVGSIPDTTLGTDSDNNALSGVMNDTTAGTTDNPSGGTAASGGSTTTPDENGNGTSGTTTSPPSTDDLGDTTPLTGPSDLGDIFGGTGGSIGPPTSAQQLAADNPTDVLTPYVPGADATASSGGTTVQQSLPPATTSTTSPSTDDSTNATPPTTTNDTSAATTSDTTPITSDMIGTSAGTTAFTSSEGDLSYTAPGGSDAAFVAAQSSTPVVTSDTPQETTIPLIPAGAEISIADFGSNPNNTVNVGQAFSSPGAAFAAVTSDGGGGSLLTFPNGSLLHFVGDNSLTVNNFVTS